MSANGRRIALTGVPRSGTTLCCRLLGEADDTVALFEPMEVERLPDGDPEAALDVIDAFFDQSRASLLEQGRAISNHVGGAVPDNPFGHQRGTDGQRVRQAHRGEIRIDKPLGPAFTLVIKHNAAFTALLPQLATRFETFAVIRNPLAVLASWHSVDLPVTQGRMPAGERLDPSLRARLDAEPDRVGRQLLLLDWVFSRYAAYLPPERILAYEQVVASGGAVLARATGLAVPCRPLEERNASRLYDAGQCRGLAERLLAAPGAWRDFYRGTDIVDLADGLAAGGGA